MMQFNTPIPVVIKETMEEGYAIYAESGGMLENDIWTCVLCNRGIVRHYNTSQLIIHSNSTFGIKKIKNNMKYPYIIYSEDGVDYILQKNFPHSIARISNKIEGHIAQHPIAGYNLYASYIGTLTGNYAKSDKFALQDMQSLISDMSSYLSEKLDKTKYEKYKI